MIKVGPKFWERVALGVLGFLAVYLFTDHILLQSKVAKIEERMSDDKIQWEVLSRQSHRMQELEVRTEVNKELMRIYGDAAGRLLFHPGHQNDGLTDDHPEDVTRSPPPPKDTPTPPETKTPQMSTNPHPEADLRQILDKVDKLGEKPKSGEEFRDNMWIQQRQMPNGIRRKDD